MKDRWEKSIASDPKLSDLEKEGVQYSVDFTRQTDDFAKRKFKEEVNVISFSAIRLTEVMKALATDDVRFVPVIACACADDILAAMFKEFIPSDVPGGPKSLLDMNGPVGALANRIRVAYSFGMVAPDILADVDRLRKVRNRVSHSWSHETIRHLFKEQSLRELAPIETIMAEKKELSDLMDGLALECAFRFRVIWIISRLEYEAPLMWRAKQSRIHSPSDALYGEHQPKRLKSIRK